MKNTEQLYTGGEIHTVDERHPSVGALAVRNGIIAAVGSESDCRSALGDHPEVIHLGGSVLLPGFIDTHLHPTLMVFYELNCDLSGVSSLEELLATLAGKVAKDDDDWILGLQFDEQNFQSPRLPTRRDLDRVSPDRPVLLLRKDGHSVIANTAAMKAAGITKSTPAPAGGVVEREPDGTPSGVFRETAAPLMLEAIPFPEMENIVAAGVRTFQKIVQKGITSIGGILQTGAEGVAGAQGAYDIALMELLTDHIPINLYSLLVCRDAGTIRAQEASALHRDRDGRMRRIGGMKFWADGTFSSRTAYMGRPFSDDPDSRGFLIHPPEEIYRRMASAHTAGKQIAVHSIGDAATRICLDLFDRLLREHPVAAHRHRIEHASQLDPRLIEDMARLKLTVSTQPMFIRSEKAWLPRRLGPERTPWTYPFRSLVDAGIPLAGASDAPIEAFDVLQAIECCVTRDGFETRQCLTAAEAVNLFTINAAYAQMEESEKGSLTVGKRADMVILSDNPASAPADRIGRIRVLQTICGGRTVHTASP